jgi:hypothetical protein
MAGFDTYDRGARLAPPYLVFPLPAVVFVVALSLGLGWWSKLAGTLGPSLAVQ